MFINNIERSFNNFLVLVCVRVYLKYVVYNTLYNMNVCIHNHIYLFLYALRTSEFVY